MPKKQKHKVVVRPGLPAATWRTLNTGLTSNIYTLKDMIAMYNELNLHADPYKEITQARHILAKHILNSIKTLKKDK